MVTVRFFESNNQPRDIVLETEHTANPTPDGNVSVDVANFEVVDAIRHFGRITIATDDAWLLRWDDSANVRRTAHSLTADGGDTVAAFEYFRQPASLPITVRRKATRAQADTAVKLAVRSREVQLDATINVRISGAPTSFLKIALPDWEITDVQVPESIRDDEIETGQSNPLVLPFRQPFTGEVTIHLSARRANNFATTPNASSKKNDRQQLDVRLPYVQKAKNSPIALLIESQANIIVEPIGEFVDAANELDSATANEAEVNTPQAFTFRGDPECDALVCSIQAKPQLLSGELSGQLEIGTHSVLANVDLAARVLHLPIESMRFEFSTDVPREMTIRLNGQPLDSRYQSWAKQANEPTSTLIVQLPKPVLGMFDLQFAYAIPFERQNPQPNGKPLAEMNIPLPQPLAGQFQGKTLAIVSGGGLTAKTGDNSWKSIDKVGNRLTLSASRWTESLSLLLDKQPGRASSKQTSIDRAYWQTWLTSKARQDRVVYVIRSEEEQLDFQLPAGVTQSRVQVLLDGSLVNHIQGNDSTIQVPLNGIDEKHVVELLCPYEGRGRHKLTLPPMLVGVDWANKLFWQIVLPNNELMIAPPTNLESEDHWSATDLITGHQSRISQAWLEEWSTGSQQVASSETMNSYVFSSIGTVLPTKLPTAKRSQLLLFVAGAIFALGLLPTFVRSLQHPFFLLAAAAGVAVTSIFLPNYAFVLAPAAALGAILLSLSRAIRWRLQPHQAKHIVSQTDSTLLQTDPTYRDLESAQTTISRMPPLHVSAPDR